VKKNADIILCCAGVYLVATSVAAVLGRMLGVRWFYDFGDGIGMAYATALNLAVAGFALVVAGLKLKE